jgi:hypothetical protein
MSPIREAIVLPMLFLTVTLLAAVRPGMPTAFASPSLFALVLATMLIATLVRGRALLPAQLLHASRSILANTNGAIVLTTLFAASAQVLAMLTPRSGLPLFFVDVLLFVLLLNTLVTQPARRELLRSLAITLGSALILKFVVLGSLSDPATFGTIAQDPLSPASGYLAFAAAALYLVGLALLASAPPQPARAELETAPRMQSIRA